MKTKYALFLALPALILFSTCTFNGKVGDDDIIIVEPPPIPEIQQFAFEKPVEMELDSSIFQVGDTLKLRFEIPDNQMVNLVNRDTISFFHPDLTLNFNLIKQDEQNNLSFSGDFVDYRILEGTEVNFTQSRNLVFWGLRELCPETGENLTFEIELIMKMAGTYSLELSNSFIQWGGAVQCNGTGGNGEFFFGEMRIFFYPYNPRLDLLYELPESTQSAIAYLFPDHPSLLNRKVVFFRVDE